MYRDPTRKQKKKQKEAIKINNYILKLWDDVI